MTDPGHYHVNEITGCWIWNLSLDQDHYPEGSAHRRSWEAANDTIIGDRDLHHLCENRVCVNPEHLEPMMRADHRALHVAQRNYCRHGHEFTLANTYVAPTTGKRGCRICRNEASTRYKGRAVA